MGHNLSLIPAPRTITPKSGAFALLLDDRRVITASSAALTPAITALKNALRSLTGQAWRVDDTTTASGTIHLQLQATGSSHEAQGYTLTITPDGITISGGAPGVYYGVMTLTQIIRQSRDALPCLNIDDAPDHPVRGVMLDISRDKVPTMETLRRLIADLAALKINQLQLYTEHTFAYSRHEVVWRDASPLTADEIQALDAECRAVYIDLVPNQNSLGHMERWLKHPPYNRLAETPDGFRRTWDGAWSAPTTLNPLDPASLKLISGLYDELLPNFTSRLFNVGCDEPWELGQGKSRSAVAERGGRVYLDWLKALHGLVRAHNRQMMFWADIIHHHPHLIPELPADIIALEWGYEANHPFETHCARFAEAGVPFYVCPGTSAWNSLTGRWTNAVENLRQAAYHGLRNGAIGYLITEWGDNGHWQPLSICYPAFAYGAAVSWGYDANHDLDLITALDRHVFLDDSQVMGELLYDIGEVYRQVGPEHINGQLLAYALQLSPDEFPHKRALYEKWGDGTADLSAQNLRSVLDRLASARERLAGHAMRVDDAELIEREIAQVIDLLAHGGKWLLHMQGAGTLSAGDLRAELETLIGRQRDLWLARNRPGGLADSLARFDTLRSAYSAPQG